MTAFSGRLATATIATLLVAACTGTPGAAPTQPGTPTQAIWYRTQP